MRYQGFNLDELLPDSGTLHLMMMHPLAVQVSDSDTAYPVNCAQIVYWTKDINDIFSRIKILVITANLVCLSIQIFNP